MEIGRVIDCPELVEDKKCNAPAEVLDVVDLDSTMGPLEHVKLKCFLGHVLFMPTEYLGEE